MSAGIQVRYLSYSANATTQTNVSLSPAVNLDHAALLISGNHHSGYGRVAGQTQAEEPLTFFRGHYMSSPTTVQIFGGSSTPALAGMFQVWEYVGDVGGPNEVRVVRFNGEPYLQLTIGGIGNKAINVFPDIGDADPERIIPVHNGIQGGATNNIDRVHVELVWNAALGRLTVQRSEAGSGFSSLTVVVQLLELRGSAWTISGPHTGNFIGPGDNPITVPPVAAWNRAFILSTSRNRSNNRAANYTIRPDPTRVDRVLVYCPDGPQVIDGIGVFGADRATFYVVRNDNIQVDHLTSHAIGGPSQIGGAGTEGVLQEEDFVLTTFGIDDVDLGTTGLVATCAAFGNETGYDSPRGHFNYRLYDQAAPKLQFVRGFQGNDTAAHWAAQIIRFAPPLYALDDFAAVEDALYAARQRINWLFDSLSARDELDSTGTDLNFGFNDQARITEALWWIKPGSVGEPVDPVADTMPVPRANWDVTVTIETQWQTDVVRAGASAVEERRGLLPRPRRICRVLFTGMDLAESAEIRRQVTRATQAPFDLPVYPDRMPLTAPASGTTLPVVAATRRVVPGSRVVVHGWDARRRPTVGQIRTVSSVGPTAIQLTDALDGTIAARGVVYPLARCRTAVEQPSIAEAGGVLQFEFESVEQDGPAMLPVRPAPTTAQAYDGNRILRWRPNWLEQPAMVAGRVVEQRPSGRTIFDRFVSSGTRVDHTLLFSPSGRDEAWDLLGFLESRQGRLVPFWVAGPQCLGTVTSVQPGSAVIALEVGEAGLSDVIRDIAFELSDGSTVIAPVEQVTVRTPGQMLVEFDGDLTTAVAPNQVRRVSTGHLVRLQDDVLLEEWASDGHARVQIAVRDTLTEPRAVSLGNFAEAVSDGVSPLEVIPDLYAHLDAAKNGLHASTPTNLDIRSAANGDLIEAELYPSLDSHVHYWADVRYQLGITAGAEDDRPYLAPRLNQLTAGNTHRIRPHGQGLFGPEVISSLGSGLPSMTRVGAVINSLILVKASDGNLAGRWFEDGFTVFLHINTPVYNGAQAYRLWREGIQVSTTDLDIMFLGHNRMAILTGPGTGPEVDYPSIYDGRSKLVVWRWNPADGFHTAWIDGQFLAQREAPRQVPATGNTNTRWLEWFATAAGSTTQPTKQPSVHLQANSLALFRRGLDVGEMNAVGQFMAQRWGTPWEDIT